jgi:hypothetical protein
LLNKSDLKGLKIETIIKQITESSEKPEVYKPRIGKINASRKYYSKA